MPTVPRYQPGQVEQRPVSGAKLDVRFPGSDPLAQGVMNAAETVGGVQNDIYRRERQKQDQLKLQDVDTQLGQWENDSLYHPETGALNVQGKDALGLPQKVLPAFDQFAGKLAMGADGDRLQAAIHSKIQDRRLGIERALEQHTSQQMEVFDAQSTDASVQNAQSAAVANYHDHDRVLHEIERQKAVISDHAARTGKPPEWTALQQSKAVTTTHVGVIDRFLSTDDDQMAAGYYQAHKEEIAGDAQAGIEKSLEIASTRGTSQKQADAIVVSSKDEGEALATVGKIADPKIRDATEERVTRHYAQERVATQAARSAAFDEAYKALKDPANAKGIDGVPAPLLAAMSPEHRQALESYADKEARGEKPPEFSQDSYDLRRMVGTGAFLKVNLLSYRGKVPDHQLDELARVQSEQAVKGLASPKVADVVGDNTAVSNALRTLNLDGPKENGDAALAYKLAYGNAVRSATAKNGGKLLSDEEKVAIAKSLAADHVITVNRSWYNPSRWVGANTTTEADGKLYTHPAAIIDANIPLPGTVKATGEGMSAEDIGQWSNALSSPNAAARADAEASLRRMASGIAADGTPDPAVRQRYEIIKAAIRASKATE